MVNWEVGRCGAEESKREDAQEMHGGGCVLCSVRLRFILWIGGLVWGRINAV
jgi:hypothetical protein